MSRTFTRWGMAGDGGGPGRPNGLALASVLCGIAGLFVLEFILGPLAIIFGGVALARANRGAGRRGMALAGLILGIIDVVLIFVLLASARNRFGWHA